MTKTCTICHVSKDFQEFDAKKTSKDGRRSQCKECRAKAHQVRRDEINATRRATHQEKMKDPAYAAAYRNQNHETYLRHKEQRKIHRHKNKDIINAKRRASYSRYAERCQNYQRKHLAENNKRINARRRELRQLNLEKKREYDREYSANRRAQDIQYRILGNLRNRIRLSLENKSECTRDLLGCSLTDFVNHLQSQFTPEMTWENYGSYWSIDHIKACCSFDLRDPEQQKQCFHWSNCQPLPIVENSRKGNSEDRLIKIAITPKSPSFSCIPQEPTSLNTIS